MGVVAEATHLHTGRAVALKAILPEWAGRSDVRARLAAEARTLGALCHPGIVEIHDALVDEHTSYLAMERLVGRTLEGLLLARPRLEVRETVQIARALVDALACVHDADIVHRDIKPANVFLSHDRHRGDVVKLIDFGLARPMRETATRAATTIPGEMVGTPAYMSLEQLGAGSVDGRADVYALSATLYECLVGSPAQEGELAEIVARILAGHSPRPVRERRPDVPTPLAELLDAGLSIRPEARPTLDAFATVLRTLVEEQARSEREPPEASEAPLPLWRRIHPRFAFVTRARVWLAGDRVLLGGTEELSSRGLQLRLPPIPRFEGRVRVELSLPGGPLELYGDVRWSRATPRWQGVGLALEPEPTGRFAAYVRELARRYDASPDEEASLLASQRRPEVT